MAMDRLGWRYLLWGACLALPLPAWAGNDCGDALQGYLEAAYPGSGETAGGSGQHDRPDGERIDESLVACRHWPADPSRTLLAVGLVPAGQEAYADGGRADLEVLVVDRATGQVQARRREPGRLGWDAIRVTGLRLDTARYRLGPGARAFGVRIERNGASRVNPWQETTLGLFLLRDGRLDRVLDNLQVAVSGGEWDGNCEGRFHVLERTLVLEPRGDGWPDLGIESRRSTTAAVRAADGECMRIETGSDRSSAVLQPQDGHYAVPGALRGADADYLLP